MQTTTLGQRRFSISLLLLTACISEIDGAINQKRVSVNLGLNDAVAVVGKVFRYTIPKDAFDGDVDSYEVTEAGGASLQKWLTWYPGRADLVGIPSDEDSGPNYVQVTAVASINSDVKDQVNYTGANPRTAGRAKDVFSIHVSDEFRLPGKRIPLEERLTCDQGPSTTITLLFAADMARLTTEEKLELLGRIASTFKTKEDALRMFSLNDDSFASLKRAILLAGAPPSSAVVGANQNEVTRSGNDVAVTWRLNCDSNVPTPETDYAIGRIMSKEANDGGGYFERKFGYPLLSWYVASVTYEAKRRRRQAGYVTPHSHIGPTGGTHADDVIVTSTPTRSTMTTRTPTVRIRPTGFVTSSSFDWNTATTSGSSRRPNITTVSKTKSTARSSVSTGRTRGTSAIRSTTAATTADVVTKKPGDAKPTLKNNLRKLHCRQHSVCYMPIPSDTFYDAEDGDTTKLTLRLDSLGDAQKQPAWLRLDDTRQVLLGLPMQAGNFLFRLTAIDSGNRHESDAFSVIVKEDPINEKELNHRIFIHFNIADEKNFTSDVKYRIVLLQKLAQYYGESTAEKIRVNSLSESGYVLSWSNISLLTDTCPTKEFKSIMHRLLLKDGQVRMQLKRFMDPPFTIHKTYIEYDGACLATTPVVDITNRTVAPAAPTEDNFLISTILPAVIITIFLIVATLVACILYRRNRQHKKGRVESRSEFVSKGAPVIFPDEVEFDKESTAATPMLLKDEKPPLQPLDFASGGGNMHDNGAGNGSAHVRSPPSAKTHPAGAGRALGKTQVSEAETELWQRPLLQDMDENPLYRPPPSFEPAGVKENRSPRPKHASPQQRDPPPYVPP